MKERKIIFHIYSILYLNYMVFFRLSIREVISFVATSVKRSR